MRRALIAAAVTSGVVAVRRRRHAEPVPPLPEQRPPARRLLDPELDTQLSVAEQQARDDRVLEALDRF